MTNWTSKQVFVDVRQNRKTPHCLVASSNDRFWSSLQPYLELCSDNFSMHSPIIPFSLFNPLTTDHHPGPSTSCWPSDLEMFHFLLLRLMYFGHFFPNCILFVWRDPVQRNGWMELCFDMMPKYEDMRIDRWCMLLNDMLCMNRSQIYQLLCFTNQKPKRSKNKKGPIDIKIDHCSALSAEWWLLSKMRMIMWCDMWRKARWYVICDVRICDALWALVIGDRWCWGSSSWSPSGWNLQATNNKYISNLQVATNKDIWTLRPPITRIFEPPSHHQQRYLKAPGLRCILSSQPMMAAQVQRRQQWTT